MAQPNSEPRRRYKLRVNFVGSDAYDADENVRPYRKLIYLAYATQRIGNVRQGIEEMFTKLYPEDSGHKVMRLRDSFMCDVSDDFLVSDVFDDSPEVYAAMEGLTAQSSATIQPGFGSPNGGTGDRPRITVRPKRKRYTLTPSREDSNESSGIQVEARNGSVIAGYDGINGSKSARLATGSASRRGTSLESDSPELTPFSPKTLANHDSVLAKRLLTASGDRNGSILTTVPLGSDIWDNADVDTSVALPPCAVVTATHAESEAMVAATVLVNGFGPPAPASRLQNTESAVEKNSDSEEDDTLLNDSMAVPRTNRRTANPTPKKATAKILLPTRRSARIARSHSGGGSKRFTGSIRFDSEPSTCCDVGRGATRKRKVAELSDSEESKDETDVESDSSQIPAMLPGSQVKDKQPTPQHSADPAPVAVADVETSETETVDQTATPSVVLEVSDPIDGATQQQTEPVAPESDPGSNEEDHSSTEKDAVAQPDSNSGSNEEDHSTEKAVPAQPDSDDASLEASAPAEPTTPEKRSTRSTSLQTKQAESKPVDDSASEDSAASEASADSATTEASENSATSDASSESVESDTSAATETELEPLASEASPEPTEAEAADPHSGEPKATPSIPESVVVSTEAPSEKLSNDASTSSEEDTSDESTSEEDDSSEEASSDEESSDDEEAEDEAEADTGVSAKAKETVVASSPAIKPIASKAGVSSSPAIKSIASKADVVASPVKAETVVASSPAIKPIASKAGVSSSPAIKSIASKADVVASPVKAVAEAASASTTEASEEESADEESSEGETSSSEEESSEESEDESESEADKETNPTPVAKNPSISAIQSAKKASVEPVKARSSTQPEKKTTTATAKVAGDGDAAKDDSSSEDESESEEDSDSSVESDSSLESESEESDSESDKSDADSTAQQKSTNATNEKGTVSAANTPKPVGQVTPPPKVQLAVELRTPTPAGRRNTLASPPLSSSRRKIQLSKPLAAVEESESSASEDDSDPPPRKLDKLPILGTPSMSRRTSGVLELAKNQRGGLRDGSGVKSISQIAGAKPYDELRKQMAKVAASRSSSSSQLQTVSFDTKAKDSSSDSESSESDSDSDSSSEEETPAKGGAEGKQAKPPAMPGKRPHPIRFAGATKLTASAKARRRTSALLNL
ncbi:hypothetical protein GGF49_002688 [Coemansia sp. RSA 1853]|nr:hypothetical protein GGF49_002688 [Coemansia sp. RSA 1853]